MLVKITTTDVQGFKNIQNAALAEIGNRGGPVFATFNGRQDYDVTTPNAQLHVCKRCGKSGMEVQLSVCKKCDRVRYCGKACQLADWKEGHKEDCKNFVSAKKRGSRERGSHEGGLVSQNISGSAANHAPQLNQMPLRERLQGGVPLWRKEGSLLDFGLLILLIIIVVGVFAAIDPFPGLR